MRAENLDFALELTTRAAFSLCTPRWWQGTKQTFRGQEAENWGLHRPGSVGSPGSSRWEHLLPPRISRCTDFLGTGLCPPWSLQVCGAFLSANHSQLSKLRRQWIFKVLNLCCNNLSAIPQITMQEGNRCVFSWLWEHEILMGEGTVDVVSRFAYDEGSCSHPSFSFSTFLFWHLGREESPKLV